ncbi:BTAD domain-containing putative transcriptional regulator [Amnibacterium flavum]|uniref:Bacterial transcriptional activator domain-containing protein n=1 Tax=Amnibacterium flavum TaxID=2173173 RepID=A0A2V1HXY2_9MICO|nr:BTAD domain-containing putative transcriptional regulator [Amnibacterium flavum]PVZ96259.1 hypothetical protein DDQ50_07560 [Amnibacterium flavum]
MSVRVSLLGGFAVSGDSAPEQVRGLIPQAVLARLAIARGEPIRAETLVRDLWLEPPDEVLSSLRAHVSRLRSRGWADVLSGGRDGYRLDADAVTVDVVELEDLVSRAGAEAEEVQRELGEALRRWHPEPLAWAREFPFSVPLAGRVAALRREAVVQLAAARISSGDAAAAVLILQPLAESTPLDGDLQRSLAGALARTGRSGDALRVLDHHIDASRDSGVDPHPEASAMRLAVLRQDPDIVGLADANAAPVERVGIPLPLTRFVGRADLLRTLERGRASSRLVTLTGAAGVGKTRLAVESTRRIDIADDEVQWLVDLTPATADDVLSRIAETVGAAEQTFDAIERAIAGRRALLVLDNAEHVLGSVAAACSRLLGLCAGLSILVTSREALRMPGERVIAVPPLVGEQLSDAVQLFLERATDASGVQSWDREQMRVIETLCTALDGLPLAIELAASRLDVLGIDELATSLRTAPDPPSRRGDGGRHETIDSAIEWSVRLTTPHERELLAQLAGFAGPFTLDMVSGICEVEDRDVRQLAVSLARKSLVHSLAGVGERRFRLLESVKQYMHRVHPDPHAASWSARHAAWFGDAAVRAAAMLTSADAAATRPRLREIRADFDQALAWSLANGERRIALSVVGSLGRFWAERGAGREVLDLIDEALALPGPTHPDEAASALRAAAFIAAVVLDPLTVVRYNRRHLEMAKQARDPVHGMLASTMCAFFAIAGGDAAEMDRLLADSETYRERITDESRWAIADHLAIRGEVLRVAGRPAASLDSLGQAYRLGGEVGHGWARANSSLVSGKTLIDVGRAADALGIIRIGAIRFLEGDDPSSALATASVYASALAALDRMPAAAEMIGAVDALGARFGYRANAVDPDYAERTRARVQAALPAEQWEAALARGRTRSIQWLVENLSAS